MSLFDWTISGILSFVLIISVIFCRRYSRDVSSFIVGGRKTKMWLGLSNNNSGGLGLVSIAYLSQEGFRHGYAITWIFFISSVLIIVLFGIFGFGIERLRASEAMTPGQYHEMRYSRKLRILIGCVQGFGGILNMAAFPVVGAAFLVSYLDWPSIFQLHTFELPTIPIISFLMISLAVIFAMTCGQVGVILTDYIQGIVIMIGLFVLNYVIFKCYGIERIRGILEANHGKSAFNPFLLGSYGTLWMLWSIIQWTLAPFSSPAIINKNASADNPKVVRLMALIVTAFGQGKMLLMITLGVGAFVALNGIIPDDAGFVSTATPEYLRTITPPLMMGLLFTAFLYAFVSTNDTCYLSYASVIMNDIVCPLKNKPFSVKGHMRALRLIIFIIGIFVYLWGVIYTPPSTILEYLLLTGTMCLGSSVALIFGLYWKRANTPAAYAAVISTLIIPIIHLTMKQLFPDKYNVSMQQAGIGAICVSIFFMIFISLVFKCRTKFRDYGKIVRESEKKD